MEDQNLTIIDIDNEFNHNNKNSCGNGISIFSDEWEKRKEQCIGFYTASCGQFKRRIFARRCQIEKIDESIACDFIEKYHIQGKNKLGLVYFGIFFKEELLGVISLGRHHRKNNNKTLNQIVLDRMCFKHEVQVIGGASRLFNECKKWAKEQKYDRILSFSNNRLTCGEIYTILGFKVVYQTKRDHSYYHKYKKIRVSKQSQKKSTSNCPEGLTEREWAGIRGFVRIWEKGKKTWAYHITPPDPTKIEEKSKRCAEQHANGVFKHSHIRGNYKSAKNQCEVYYGSSYELRCIYQLENNPEVSSYRRMNAIKTDHNSWRNPDLFVNINGEEWIFEVKPKKTLIYQDVIDQIYDSTEYCKKNNIKFRIWTEDDADMNEKQIIIWAKNIIAEETGNFIPLIRYKENHCRHSKKYYHEKVKTNRKVFMCDFCKEIHDIMTYSYNLNIKKNGKYLCPIENGKNIGSRPKAPIEPPTENKCKECKETKPIDQFRKDSSRKHGYKSYCLDCARKIANQRYQNKKKK